VVAQPQGTREVSLPALSGGCGTGKGRSEARPDGYRPPARSVGDRLHRDEAHRCEPCPTDAWPGGLEGFHAVTHAIRFGGETLGDWTADPGQLDSLLKLLAPDVNTAFEVVDIEALQQVVPRGQVVAVARRPVQPAQATVLDAPGHVLVIASEPHPAERLCSAAVILGVVGVRYEPHSRGVAARR
jgi:hypothetical protein